MPRSMKDNAIKAAIRILETGGERANALKMLRSALAEA